MNETTYQTNQTGQRSTVVGVFDYYNTARAAARELEEIGIPREDINVQSNVATGTAGGSADGGSYENREHQEHHGGISGFFHRLFGGDDDDSRNHYSEAIRRGGSVVVVTAAPNLIERVADILNQHGAIDIDRRAESYRQSGWSGYDENAPAYSTDEAERERERYRETAGTQTIPVVEEEIAVGKRVVRRGGVRIYTEVVEEPVTEQVNLRDEKVRVERRPVNREAAPGDMNLRDQSIEVTETTEEPVVSKRARVKEEVVVGKDVTNRTETVTDKVRRTKVNVEKLDEETDAGDRRSGL